MSAVQLKAHQSAIPRLSIPAKGFAADHAVQLLDRLDLLAETRETAEAGRHPDLAWARSGAMALTGRPEGPPLLAPAAMASAAEGALLALRALAGRGWRGGELDGPALLAERAAIFGYQRQGDIAPGGSCRLLRARDGWIALNLARPEDRELIPAWLEDDAGRAVDRDIWEWLGRSVAGRSVAVLVERGRLIGLPLASAEGVEAGREDWLRVRDGRACPPPAVDCRPRVLDLSSLWAGPLCGHLLMLAGAEVVKLESEGRPDGARRGPAHFFDLLNGGKACAAVDFTRDRSRLMRLIESADIVIESSRPRALRQLGIRAEEIASRRTGLSWVSITGHGREEPGAQWVAFGDDAGVAAGLARAVGESAGEPGPLFCADAIADPLTGLHAAVAALASWRVGGSRVLDVSLRDNVAALLALGMPESRAQVIEDPDAGWWVGVGAEREAVAAPRARSPETSAASLGGDTRRVLAEWGIAP